MQKRAMLCSLGVAAILLLLGREPLPAVSRPTAPTIQWQLTPQSAPTSTTSLNGLDPSIPANTDLWVCRLDVTAAAANVGAVNLTIQDGNGIPFWDTVPVQPGQWVPIIESSGPNACPWFPKGMTFLASGPGLYIRANGGQ